MRSIVCINVCIICMFATIIASIDDCDIEVSVWGMRVSAEGRLRIGVGMVCSSSYVSSSVTFGMSVGGSVDYSFD
jgi:hypothetical protein